MRDGDHFNVVVNKVPIPIRYWGCSMDEQLTIYGCSQSGNGLRLFTARTAGVILPNGRTVYDVEAVGEIRLQGDGSNDCVMGDPAEEHVSSWAAAFTGRRPTPA